MTDMERLDSDDLAHRAGTMDVSLGRIADQTISLEEYREGASVVRDWSPLPHMRRTTTNPDHYGFERIDSDDPRIRYWAASQRHTRGT